MVFAVLFVVGSVAWVLSAGWTSSWGLASFVLLVLSMVGLVAQRFAN
jgi:hypothetical protein